MQFTNTPTEQHGSFRTCSSSTAQTLENPFEADACVFDTPSPSATITSLVDEPLFHTSYLSQGDKSYTSFDAMSTYSVESLDSSFDDFDATFPEVLAEEMGLGKQQIIHAQAVQIAFRGRPTVVELKNEKPTVTRASMMSFQRPALSPVKRSYTTRPIRISTDSRSSKSSEYSADNKSVSTEASDHSAPTTPQLESGSITPSSEYSPLTPDSRSVEEPSTLKTKDSSPATPTTIKPTKKPSRLRLFARRTLSMHNPPEAEMFKDLPATPEVPRTMNLGPLPTIKSKPKLLARGANEREPLFELPPSPMEEEIPSIPKRNANRNSFMRKPQSQPQRIRRMESHMGLNQR